MEPAGFAALIFDLDGVLTRTAHLHARAWKEMFRAYFDELREAGRADPEPYADKDYGEHLDGKPRYRGVQSVLESRGIDLDHGSPDDPPDRETVCGLGNRKNEIFHRLLEDEGAEVFEDARTLAEDARERGVGLAVVSSSRNCVPILESAGLRELFEVVVDGNAVIDEGLSGKPEPDIFLRAARALGAAPAACAVFEDALSGVRAAAAGGFGLVVGVNRLDEEHARQLAAHGAHVVLEDISPLAFDPARCAACDAGGQEGAEA